MKQLLIALTLCSTGFAVAQGETGLGIAQTALKKNAMNFAIDYSKKLDSIASIFKANRSSTISFTPEIKVLLGSEDAFNGITAKYCGNIMVFRKTTIAGIEVPDLSRAFNNFPVSIGTETNRNFSFVNGILEAGYIPWYQNSLKVNKYLRQTKVGIFIQGGYKFALNDSITVEQGGSRDQSLEKLNDNIFRIKAVFGFEPKFYFDKEKKEFGVSPIGRASIWYDALNNEVYYNLVGKIRFMLKKDYYFDFGYEKGSGAPNFNEGEQFTANLGVRF